MLRRCGLIVLVACLLLADRPAALSQQPPRTDLQGDPLPEGALVRLGTSRFRPPSQVRGLAFSPDDKTLVSLSGGLLQFWDAVHGKLLRQVETASHHNQCFDLSPDGKFLAFAGPHDENPVRLWNLN